MIVKCIDDTNHKGWIIRNKEYVAISLLFFERDNICKVCIEPEDEGSPIFFEIDCFEIVDNRIPYNWITSLHGEQYWIEPREFEGNFWERYHDEDVEDPNSEIGLLYKRAVNSIKRFHGIEVREPKDLSVIISEYEDNILSEESLQELTWYIEEGDINAISLATKTEAEMFIPFIEPHLKSASPSLRISAIKYFVRLKRNADQIFDLVLHDINQTVRSVALREILKMIDDIDNTLKKKMFDYVYTVVQDTLAARWLRRDAYDFIQTALRIPIFSQKFLSIDNLEQDIDPQLINKFKQICLIK